MLNDKMISFFADRLKKMGELNSGMYHYYTHLLETGKILTDEDEYLIDHIRSNYDTSTEIHEMAAGAAQLGHALSVLGYDVVATEMDSRRYALAKDLGKYLGSDCKISKASSFTERSDFGLAITNNAATSFISVPDAIKYFKSVFKNEGIAIINPALFGEAREKVKVETELEANGIIIKEMDKGFVSLFGVESIPLNPIPEELISDYDSAMAIEKLAKKIDRTKCLSDELAYISKWIHEIKKGGLTVLDIGDGIGYFLEVCREYGCAISGIGINTYNQEGWDKYYSGYEKLSDINHVRQKIPLRRLNMMDCIEIGALSDDYQEYRYDIINCKHTINLIMKDYFDFKKNEWKATDALFDTWDRFMGLMNRVVKPHGVLMLSALKCENIIVYDNLVRIYAKIHGWEVEQSDFKNNHKLRKL